MPWPDWLDDIWTPVPKGADDDNEKFSRWRARVRRVRTDRPAITFISPLWEKITIVGLQATNDEVEAALRAQWEKEKHDFV